VATAALLLAALLAAGCTQQVSATSSATSPSPLATPTEYDWAAVSCGDVFTGALKKNGTLWTWGANNYGQLGLGDRVGRAAPTQVGHAHDWATVACGFGLTLAIKRDGSLWAWGWNMTGGLGIGDTTDRSNPTRIGTAHDWASVSCGDQYSVAIKRDGSLWAWGWNDSGMLGLGDTNGRNRPTEVGTLHDWVSVSCGDAHALAIQKDGTLWAWGRNDYGQLGLGDTTDRHSPTHVGNAHDWVAVSCGGDRTLALKSDDTIWGWGDNISDPLALGGSDTSPHLRPHQIGHDDDWAAVYCGFAHTLAIKTNGTLWGWGNDVDGQLGLGNTNNPVDAPTQVGGANDWASASGGAYDTRALTKDGALWAMGENNYGQLGLGDLNQRDVPTPVSSTRGRGLLGYWRWPGAKAAYQPHLFYIHRVGAGYVLEAPPMMVATQAVPLENGRLVFHFMQTKREPNGSLVTTRRESERWWLYLIDGGRRLVWADSIRAPFTDKTALALTLERATGSPKQLASELRGWQANVAINNDLDMLAQAVKGYPGTPYPTRASLLPGGAFWKWKGAPHLRNALTGGPMVLGDAVGDFSYTASNKNGHSWKLTVHLYGGFTNTQSEWSAQ